MGYGPLQLSGPVFVDLNSGHLILFRIYVMKQEFCTPYGKHSMGSKFPTLRDVMDIPSHMEQYQVNQICDILMGCILNNLVPSRKREKVLLRQYLVSKLGVKNLLRESWGHYSKRYVEERWPKFNIWYWMP